MAAQLRDFLGTFPRAGRRHWLSATADLAFGGRFRGLSGVNCTCGAGHPDQANKLDRMVFFVFRPGTSSWGSVRLRVFQLASALKSAVQVPDSVKVVTDSQLSNLKVKDADFVISKYLLAPSTFSWLADLRSRGNRVFADIVDGFPSPGIEDHVDAFLCASRSEFTFRLSRGVPSTEILHQVDSRFAPRGFDRARYELGYLGGAGGALHTELVPDLEKRYTKLSMTDSEARRLSRQVERWSHHYSVRTFFGEGVFKPATKAFVAARFGAVFVGSREDAESLLILGEDYPYLAESSTSDSVLQVAAAARETFGGPDWQRAVEVMSKLRRKTCDIQIGGQLANAFISPS